MKFLILIQILLTLITCVLTHRHPRGYRTQLQQPLKSLNLRPNPPSPAQPSPNVKISISRPRPIIPFNRRKTEPPPAQNINPQKALRDRMGVNDRRVIQVRKSFQVSEPEALLTSEHKIPLVQGSSFRSQYSPDSIQSSPPEDYTISVSYSYGAGAENKKQAQQQWIASVEEETLSPPQLPPPPEVTTWSKANGTLLSRHAQRNAYSPGRKLPGRRQQRGIRRYFLLGEPSLRRQFLRPRRHRREAGASEDDDKDGDQRSPSTLPPSPPLPSISTRGCDPDEDDDGETGCPEYDEETSPVDDGNSANSQPDSPRLSAHLASVPSDLPKEPFSVHVVHSWNSKSYAEEEETDVSISRRTSHHDFESHNPLENPNERKWFDDEIDVPNHGTYVNFHYQYPPAPPRAPRHFSNPNYYPYQPLRNSPQFYNRQPNYLYTIPFPRNAGQAFGLTRPPPPPPSLYSPLPPPLPLSPPPPPFYGPFPYPHRKTKKELKKELKKEKIEKVVGKLEAVEDKFKAFKSKVKGKKKLVKKLVKNLLKPPNLFDDESLFPKGGLFDDIPLPGQPIAVPMYTHGAEKWPSAVWDESQDAPVVLALDQEDRGCDSVNCKLEGQGQIQGQGQGHPQKLKLLRRPTTTEEPAETYDENVEEEYSSVEEVTSSPEKKKKVVFASMDKPFEPEQGDEEEEGGDEEGKKDLKVKLRRGRVLWRNRKKEKSKESSDFDQEDEKEFEPFVIRVPKSVSLRRGQRIFLPYSFILETKK